MLWLQCLVAGLVLLHCLAEEDEAFSYLRYKRAADDAINKQFSVVTILPNRYFIIQNTPYTMMKKNKAVPSSRGPVTGLVEGYIPDLIAELANHEGFTYEIYLVQDGLFGFCDYQQRENITLCKGLIGDIYNGKHDIAAAPITITRDREKHINFVRAFQSVGLTVLVKKEAFNKDPWKEPLNFDIFTPLDKWVYLFVTLLTIATGLLLWLMNRFNPYEWGGRHDLGLADKSVSERFNLSSSLWFVFTSLQWQGFEHAPRSLGSKVLTVFWFIFVTITLVTYTGSLMNHLFWASSYRTVHPFKPPFRNLEELVSSNVYKYGAIGGGSTERILRRLAQGEMYDTMRNFWSTECDEECFPRNMTAAVDKVRKEKFALIMESNSAHHLLNQQPCDLTTIGDIIHPKSYGLAVKHNFEHLDKLHMGILDLHESGELARLEKKWWVDRGECWNVTKLERTLLSQNYLTRMNKPQRVEISHFWGALVLMAVGIVLCILVGLAEAAFYKYRGRYAPSNRPGGQQLTNQMDDDAGRI